MFSRIQTVGSLVRYLGPGWLLYRLWYSLLLKSSRLRHRTPMTAWSQHPFTNLCHPECQMRPVEYLAYRRERAPQFFFAPEDLSQFKEQYQETFAQWDSMTVDPMQQAQALSQGTFIFFEHQPVTLGFPPRWFGPEYNVGESHTHRHWSKIDDFSQGDIKQVWEASRFSFVYGLVRAYWRTQDEQYAELFWQAIEDWHIHNPPNRGPNWKCGQEVSFRVMAWTFGLYGFLTSPTATPERVAQLVQMIGLSGERIAANVTYALSQRNNHGISEGVGLWTIGTLFPELAQASRWLAMGEKILEEQGQALIALDGGFSQHSFNYQRLMLHDYLWVFRLDALNQQQLSDALRQRVIEAGKLLYQLQDETSGGLPRYGQNDGALILPLSNCCSQNFRPVLQSIHYFATGQRCYPAGSWDEEAFWLFGSQMLEAPIAPPKQTDLQAKTSGYYTLRSASGFAYTRCGRFQTRPSQADLLHVDIWWQGENIALDPGTYSYNAPQPWNNPLAETGYHNCVMIDGQSQMKRTSRFLWLPWIKGRMTNYAQSSLNEITYWEGTHNGYEQLSHPVIYRRAIVRLGEDQWLVLDLLTSQQAHNYLLHWLLADYPYQWDGEGHCLLDTPQGKYNLQTGLWYVEPAREISPKIEYELVRGSKDSPRGWYAPNYSDKKPALSIMAQTNGTTVGYWSLFAPVQYEFQEDEQELKWSRSDSQIQIQKQKSQQQGLAFPMIEHIQLIGREEDSLSLIAQ